MTCSIVSLALVLRNFGRGRGVLAWRNGDAGGAGCERNQPLGSEAAAHGGLWHPLSPPFHTLPSLGGPPLCPLPPPVHLQVYHQPAPGKMSSHIDHLKVQRGHRDDAQPGCMCWMPIGTLPCLLGLIPHAASLSMCSSPACLPITACRLWRSRPRPSCRAKLCRACLPLLVPLACHAEAASASLPAPGWWVPGLEGPPAQDEPGRHRQAQARGHAGGRQWPHAVPAGRAFALRACGPGWGWGADGGGWVGWWWWWGGGWHHEFAAFPASLCPLRLDVLFPRLNLPPVRTAIHYHSRCVSRWQRRRCVRSCPSNCLYLCKRV